MHLLDRALHALTSSNLVMECHAKRSSIQRCITDLEDQERFTFLETERNGNSFFHALALFYGFHHHASYHAINIREEIASYLYQQHNLSHEWIKHIAQDGTWDATAEILLPCAAAEALRITIHLYDIVSSAPAPSTKKRILSYHYPQEQIIPENNAISILRLKQGHYGLLLPSY